MQEKLRFLAVYGSMSNSESLDPRDSLGKTSRFVYAIHEDVFIG